jgi:hypothetical protein
VAAEAKHVRPRGQPKIGQFREFAQAQADGDKAAGVLADRQLVEPVGSGDAAVEGAGALSGLGGVLGDISRDPDIG